MKLQTTKFYNVTVKIDNQKVSFDKNGVGEIGAELTVFPPHIFEFGKVPTVKSEKEVVKDTDPREIVDLKNEIGRLNRIIEDKNKKLQAAQMAEKHWRDLVDKMSGDNNKEVEAKTEVESSTDPEMQTFIAELEKTHHKSIPKMLADVGISVPPELTTKAEMIQFVKDLK